VLLCCRYLSQNQIAYGYAPGGIGVFNAELTAAMNQTDQAIQTFLDNMNAAGTANSTAVILTAKHGQNPLNPAEVRRLI
jgi:membrane-anchored protein YejM (alkaline phosphatase superfamily)